MVDKVMICSAVGTVCSVIAGFFGGWSIALKVLIVFMIIDYITGIITAICKKSPKTRSGGLRSSVGLRGICKKVYILLFVIIAYYVDALMGMQYIRDAVCIGFALNELLSITENARLIGLKLPKAVDNILDLLQNKADENKK